MSTRVFVRSEAGVQAALMLGVGSVAASAAWSHVVDLAQQHGQPGWLAVADAAVLETLAVSMGLEVRRRRRSGNSVLFAACVLVSAVALQLSAQVAQAPRTFWGWTMAALPAVGFLVLAKTAITRTTTAHPVHEVRLKVPPPPAVLDPPMPVPTPTSTTPPVDVLHDVGRLVADELAGDDLMLTRAALLTGLRARGVRIGTTRAGELLAALRDERAEDPTSADRLLAAIAGPS